VSFSYRVGLLAAHTGHRGLQVSSFTVTLA
jgi:hypothetical protein